jgi:hypothetical protein
LRDGEEIEEQERSRKDHESWDLKRRPRMREVSKEDDTAGHSPDSRTFHVEVLLSFFFRVSGVFDWKTRTSSSSPLSLQRIGCFAASRLWRCLSLTGSSNFYMTILLPVFMSNVCLSDFEDDLFWQRLHV